MDYLHYDKGRGVLIDHDFNNRAVYKVLKQTPKRMFTTVTTDGHNTYELMTNRLAPVFNVFTGITEKAKKEIWEPKKIINKLTNVTTDYNTALDFSYDFETGKYDDLVAKISDIPIQAFQYYRKKDYQHDGDITYFEDKSLKEKWSIIKNETMFLINIYPYLDIININFIKRQ